jgi:hypothetical protein
VIGIGFFLPAAHSTTLRLRLKQAPDAVWAAITAPGPQAWRKDLLKREPRPDENGKKVWFEQVGRFGMTLRFDEFDPPKRWVSTIADPKLPFQGRWVYELEPNSGGTVLTVTEEGIVDNPLYRVMGKVSDPSKTLNTYLQQLATHFDEPAAIEKVNS